MSSLPSLSYLLTFASLPTIQVVPLHAHFNRAVITIAHCSFFVNTVLWQYRPLSGWYNMSPKNSWSQTGISNNRMINCTSLHFSYVMHALHIVQIRCRLSLTVVLIPWGRQQRHILTCFVEHFCSGVTCQPSACGACAHALCTGSLNGIKVCTSQSIILQLRHRCALVW